MSTTSNYPGGIDTFEKDWVDGDDMGDETPGSVLEGPHAAHHNKIGDALEKIENALGVDPAGSYDTVVQRLDAIVGGSGSELDWAIVPSTEFPAVGDNSTDDTTVLQDAIDSGRPVYISEGNYKITSELQLSGNIVMGAGWLKTRIIQHTEADAVFVIDGRMRLTDLACEHSARPSTATVPDGVAIRCREVDDTSVIERVYCFKCTSGIYCSEVYGADSSAYIFSTRIADCKIKDFTHSAMFLGSTNAGNTGNVVENVLSTNNDSGGSPQACLSAAFTFKNWAQGFVGQLNVEHMLAPRAVDINSCRVLWIRSLNIETVEFTNNLGGLVYVFGSNTGTVDFGSMRLRDCTFDDANLTTGYAILRIDNAPQVNFVDVYEHVSTITGTPTLRRLWANSATEGASVTFGRWVTPNFSADFVASTVAPIVRRSQDAYRIVSDSVSRVPLEVYGITGQGVDLVRIYDDDPAVVASVDLNGNLKLPGAGYLEITDRTAPGTPASGTARLYQDDSATPRVFIKTSDGTATQIAPAPATYLTASDLELRDAKQSVRAATAAALPANTRSGNVLTGNANGALAAIDGITLIAGDRLLVKDEAAANLKHGIYTVTVVGDGSNPFQLTRATDADASADVTTGMFTFVEEGSTQAGTIWALTTANPITLNTTTLTFTCVGASTSSFMRTVLDDTSASAARTTLDVPAIADLSVVTLNNQTGTTYTLALSDAGKVVELNNASPITLTVPPNSDIAFPTGSVVELWRQGAGTVTVAPGSGVTIRSAGGLLSARVQYSVLSLRKRDTNEWVLSGDLV